MVTVATRVAAWRTVETIPCAHRGASAQHLRTWWHLFAHRASPRVNVINPRNAGGIADIRRAVARLQSDLSSDADFPALTGVTLARIRCDKHAFVEFAMAVSRRLR
jgi:hypothetical protein